MVSCSNGIQRDVIPASSFNLSSHSRSPHHIALINPGLLSAMSFNSSMLTDRVPDGYVLPAQTKITVREDTSEIQDFEVEIRPTVIKIEAVDKKTQTPLEGVKISVVNEKGKKIWKHVTLTALKEKVIPSWYTIQVEKVPKGYQKPKNQKIKVKAVANVKKYKVELTKEAQVQTEKRVDTDPLPDP